MIYTRAGFLAVVWFGSSPSPTPSTLSQSSCVSPDELIYILTGGVAKYDRESLASIKRSILSLSEMSTTEDFWKSPTKLKWWTKRKHNCLCVVGLFVAEHPTLLFSRQTTHLMSKFNFFQHLVYLLQYLLNKLSKKFTVVKPFTQ